MEGKKGQLYQEDGREKLKERKRGTWIQPSIPSTQQILTRASHEHHARQWRMWNDNAQHPGN